MSSCSCPALQLETLGCAKTAMGVVCELRNVNEAFFYRAFLSSFRETGHVFIFCLFSCKQRKNNQEADSMRVSAGPPPNLRGKQRMPRYKEQAPPVYLYQLVPSFWSMRNIHVVT